MPFERTAETLNRLIDKTIKDNPELRDGLARVRYDDREFHDEIAADPNQIWDVASGEIRKFDVEQQELESRLAVIDKELGEDPSRSTSRIRDDDGVYVVGGLMALYT